MRFPVDTVYFITQAPSKYWLDYVVAFAPICVSIVAIAISVWVALRQNWAVAAQLKKDLFDRRFDVYKEIGNYMLYVFQVNGRNVIHGENYVRFQDDSI